MHSLTAQEEDDDMICLVYDSDDLMGSQNKARAAGESTFMVSRGESANIVFWVNAVAGNAPYRTGLVLRHADTEATQPLEQATDDTELEACVLSNYAISIALGRRIMEDDYKLGQIAALINSDAELCRKIRQICVAQP